MNVNRFYVQKNDINNRNMLYLPNVSDKIECNNLTLEHNLFLKSLSAESDFIFEHHNINITGNSINLLPYYYKVNIRDTLNLDRGSCKNSRGQYFIYVNIIMVSLVLKHVTECCLILMNMTHNLIIMKYCLIACKYISYKVLEVICSQSYIIIEHDCFSVSMDQKHFTFIFYLSNSYHNNYCNLIINLSISYYSVILSESFIYFWYSKCYRNGENLTKTIYSYTLCLYISQKYSIFLYFLLMLMRLRSMRICALRIHLKDVYSLSSKQYAI